MKQKLLIKNLNVEIEGEEILRGVNLEIPEGETHILFGPNGCGKSTLLKTLMGYPKYRITKGTISFKSKKINKLGLNERAQLGIGVMYQRPPEVKGVPLKKILEIISDNKELKEKDISDLELEEYLDRDLNLGFSGGETKKAEKLLQKSFDTKIMDRKKMGLIITHTGYILDFIEADKAYVMIDGAINCSGNPHEIFEAIQKNGFEGCKACLENK